MRFPILAKLVAVGLVFLVLAWAIDRVSGIVAERNGRLYEAQRSVADSLASSQTVVGPVLQRTCREKWEVETGEGKARRKVSEERTMTLRSLPATLRVEAETRTDPRYRGIYRVNGYVLKAELVGEWTGTDALVAKRDHDGSTLECDPTVVWVGVSDARGIRAARIDLQGENVPVVPGSAATGAQTFRGAVPDRDLLSIQPFQITVDLELIGTQHLAFVPVGDSTQVNLASDWPHPSFGGRFLPERREVTPNGFTASWKISALATQAPQQVRGSGALCQPPVTGTSQATVCIESFGVGFIDPVSPYTLSDRATKYGLLFIFLTFVAVALVEVLLRLRVHPLQYLLVGAALTTFFLLLVSLSEHVSFGYAYLAASAACTALLSFYGSFVLGGAGRGIAFGAAIGAIFGTLYVLLLQEQTALVIGSLLVFLVLTGAMIVTRSVDWYSAIAQIRSERHPAASR
jgi:inner membrane protein